MYASRRNVRGFTLVEALVALLALSIGLLGVAALQMSGLRNNLGASWRTQATYLAYDIVDRMRANRSNATNYVVGPGAYSGSGSIAANDLAAWKANLSTVLPNGDGEVAVTTVGRLSTVTVTVRWSDNVNDPDVTNPTLTFVTRSII